MEFPEHKCGLYLTHNEHKDVYQSLEGWLAERATFGEDGSDWVSEEQRQKALESDECWKLQWYPDTPVGSYLLYAADLDALLEAARKVV